MGKRATALVVGLVLVSGCKSPTARAYDAAAGELPAARTAATAAGLAIEPVGFGPPAVPDATNAAKGYARALSLLNARPTRAATVEAITKAWDGDFKGYQKLAKPLGVISTEIQSSSRLAAANFGTDFVDGPLSNLDAFTQIRLLARVSGANALAAAQRRDWAAVEEWVRVGYRVAAHVLTEPRMEGALCSMQILRIQMSLCEKLIRLAKNDPVALARLEAAQQSRPPYTYRENLRGEIVIMIALMRHFKSEQRGVRQMGEQLALYAGLTEDEKTRNHLALLDELDPQLARNALESRMLAFWTEVWPALKDEPDDIGPTMLAAQEKRIKTADPADVIVRTGFSHLGTALGGLQDAREGLLAIDIALAYQRRQPLSADRVALMRKLGTSQAIQNGDLVISRKSRGRATRSELIRVKINP